VERVVIDHGTYQRLVGDAIDLIASSTAPGDRGLIERVASELRAAFIGKVWPLHMVHGDFKAGNILIGRDGIVSGFIDWDMWEEKGLPLQDLLVLFAYDWSKASGFGFGPRLLPDLLAGTWRPIYEDILGERARVLDLSNAQVRVLRAVFWLRNLQDRRPALVFVNREASQTWIDGPLRQIAAILSQ
jgi:Ser/Thr protein kinase RdoA (MazF antagonist)